jgi:site-specific recombinase XerD
MIDDMTLRKLSPRTQAGYLRAVVKFTRFFGQSPDLASPDDLRAFQLHLVEQGVSCTTINATLTGLGFLFEVTLERPDALKRTSRVRQPQKLPRVLSTEEVARLLTGARNPKHRAALAVAYGAGLRASEVVHLRVSDIDNERMIVRVVQGKGQRDRYAMLSPSLLELLRTWWRHGQAHGQMRPGGWLFPGRNPVNPLSTRQLNHVLSMPK